MGIDAAAFLARLSAAFDGVQFRRGGFARSGFINDWIWITVHLLWESPRHMDMRCWHIAQLWDPFADENSIWVMIYGLFGGVIGAHAINTRRARLHLELRVMDAWFVIEKKPRQIETCLSPIEP